jgi:hypothetical protein
MEEPAASTLTADVKLECEQINRKSGQWEHRSVQSPMGNFQGGTQKWQLVPGIITQKTTIFISTITKTSNFKHKMNH